MKQIVSRVQNGMIEFARFMFSMGIWIFIIWCIVKIHLYFSLNNKVIYM